MGLNLIKRGEKLHPNEVAPGSGWVNTTRPGSNHPYFVGPGELLVTVTATGCDGVRIYDWDKDGNPFVESTSRGTMHSAVSCVSGTRLGPVIRVLNPTESTEVTIMSRPLPPPLFRRICLGWLPWR